MTKLSKIHLLKIIFIFSYKKKSYLVLVLLIYLNCFLKIIFEKIIIIFYYFIISVSMLPNFLFFLFSITKQALTNIRL